MLYHIYQHPVRSCRVAHLFARSPKRAFYSTQPKRRLSLSTEPPLITRVLTLYLYLYRSHPPLSTTNPRQQAVQIR